MATDGVKAPLQPNDYNGISYPPIAYSNPKAQHENPTQFGVYGNVPPSNTQTMGLYSNATGMAGYTGASYHTANTISSTPPLQSSSPQPQAIGHSQYMSMTSSYEPYGAPQTMYNPNPTPYALPRRPLLRRRLTARTSLPPRARSLPTAPCRHTCRPTTRPAGPCPSKRMAPRPPRYTRARAVRLAQTSIERTRIGSTPLRPWDLRRSNERGNERTGSYTCTKMSPFPRCCLRKQCCSASWYARTRAVSRCDGRV